MMLKTSKMKIKERIVQAENETEIRKRYFKIIEADPEIEEYVKYRIEKSKVFLLILAAEFICIGFLAGVLIGWVTV